MSKPKLSPLQKQLAATVKVKRKRGRPSNTQILQLAAIAAARELSRRRNTNDE